MPPNRTGPAAGARTESITVDNGNPKDIAAETLRDPGAAVQLSPAGTILDGQILRQGRNESPALLFDAFFSNSITLDDMRLLLPGVWQMAEYPTHNLPADIWLEWFRMVGWTATDNRLAPIEAVQLYRGATWGRRRGMSWTPDLDLAQWFADRFAHRGPAHVYECQVPTDALLAFVEERRGEPEYVIDPRALPSLGRTNILAPAGVSS